MTAEATGRPVSERARARAALACACALVAGVVALAPGARAASTGPIAFVSDRGGDPEIFKMSADGTGVVQLTSNTAWDTDPSWSPDGTKLAFSSNSDGDEDIYVMTSEGAMLANLTDGGVGNDRQPDWSPDGTKLVFARGNDLFRVSSSGGAVTKLTFGRSPSWSPDGTKIAFARPTRSGGDIFVMAVDGSNVQALTQGMDADSPEWSPSGRRIAFEATGSNGDESRIYTMGPLGGALTELPGTGDDYSPTWSGDGASLVFTNLTLDAEIFVAAADGSARRPLTSDDAYDFLPSWAPCTGTGCAGPGPTDSPTSPGTTPTAGPTTPGTTPTATPTVTPTDNPTPPGDLVASTTSLQFLKTRTTIKAAGSVRPAHPGHSVKVLLAKRKGARWVKVALRLPTINSEGNFAARFKNPPRAKRCRLTASFAGDDDHLPSRSSRSFRC